MNLLVISCSLNPGSRSRLLAEAITNYLEADGFTVGSLDLRKTQMPLCDGSSTTSSEILTSLHNRIKTSHGIVMCVPIYNFDVNAAAKNLIELTGPSWTGKVVGFACAAGGKSSYMSVMGVANSLMLDFRAHIIPRFVYATGESF
ncbi:MAG: NAD(P)H-dependent oxidoreductase, partial [Verrucomicrobiaceae bacterium]|nr:NAD(P)H-dependent oxidoreductase [Verrucomicrobiaceae bacterium]